jgi:hypothetical protein
MQTVHTIGGATVMLVMKCDDACLGFDILTALVMKSSVFSVVTPRGHWTLTCGSEEYDTFMFRVDQ